MFLIYLFQKIPMYHIFLETSQQIQIDDGDSSHLDIHQGDHDYQDVLQVQEWILMDLYGP